MKQLSIWILTAALVLGLTGCVQADVPGENEGSEKDAAGQETTLETPSETEPDYTIEAPDESLPANPDALVEPGLFRWEGKESETPVKEELLLRSDGRMYAVFEHSGEAALSHFIGNYQEKDGKLTCQYWFLWSGDGFIDVAADEGESYVVLDENQIARNGFDGIHMLSRVTEAQDTDRFIKTHDIIHTISQYTIRNRSGEEEDETAPVSKAAAVYRYSAEEGTLESVELILFENGRYYLEYQSKDSETPSFAIGNFYQAGDEFRLKEWAVGNGEALQLNNKPLERYAIEEDELVTREFRDLADGLEIRLKLAEDADLKEAAAEHDITKKLIFSEVFNYQP